MTTREFLSELGHPACAYCLVVRATQRDHDGNTYRQSRGSRECRTCRRGYRLLVTNRQVVLL